MRTYLKVFLAWAAGMVIVLLMLAASPAQAMDVGWENVWEDNISCDANGSDFGYNWSNFLRSLGLVQVAPLVKQVPHPTLGKVETVVAGYMIALGDNHVKVFHYAYVYETGDICLLGTSDYIGISA